MSSLGVDHTALLGETVAEIAWHKAGIIKPGDIFFKKTFLSKKYAREKGVGGIGKHLFFLFLRASVLCERLERIPPSLRQ